MKLRGFTFIEILIAMAFVSIVSAFGTASYRDYTDTRVLNTAADEVVSVLNLAKSRAQTQVKPEECGSSELEGYSVTFCRESTDCTEDRQIYKIQAVCSGLSQQIEKDFLLPKGVMFLEQDRRDVLFKVLNGSAESNGPITLVLKEKMKTITINRQSVISTSGLEPLVPTPVPTVELTDGPVQPVSITMSFLGHSGSEIDLATNDSVTFYWTVTGNVTLCEASGLWDGEPRLVGTKNIEQVKEAGEYIITCSGPGGNEQKSLRINLTDGPSLDLNGPSIVEYGQTATLNWTSTDAVSCEGVEGDGNFLGSQNTSGTYISTPLLSNTIFKLTCYNQAGARISEIVSVSVNQPSVTPTVFLTYTPAPTNTVAPTIPVLTPPTATPIPSPTPTRTPTPTNSPIPSGVTLAANKSSVLYGNEVTLTWSSINATSCTASGAWSGTKSASGTEKVYPTSPTTTYEIICSNATGSSAKVTRSVDTNRPDRKVQWIDPDGAGQSVNIRTGPGTSYSTTGTTIPPFGISKLLDPDYTTSGNYRWYNLRYNSTDGWAVGYDISRPIYWMHEYLESFWSTPPQTSNNIDVDHYTLIVPTRNVKIMKLACRYCGASTNFRIRDENNNTIYSKTTSDTGNGDNGWFRVYPNMTLSANKEYTIIVRIKDGPIYYGTENINRTVINFKSFKIGSGSYSNGSMHLQLRIENIK